MKTSILALSASAVFVISLCFASAAFAQQSITKLEIPEKGVFTVDKENMLKVDTLIMHDKSSIVFDAAKYGLLEAKVAFIGNKCLISSKGQSGGDSKELLPGEDGAYGGNLSIVMGYERLGKLTIDVRGGDGGNGMNGKDGKNGIPDRYEKKTMTDKKGNPYTTMVLVPGTPGTDGSNATMGANGGDGGNLLLMYSTKDFIPIFNQENRDKNSIVILYTAGESGKNGVPGKGGVSSVDGALVPSYYRNANDGHIQLINLDAEVSSKGF